MSSAVHYKCCLDQTGCRPACEPFTADTLAHAQAFAQALATLLQRAVYLNGNGLTPPHTLYTPNAPGSSLGNAPTGISF